MGSKTASIKLTLDAGAFKSGLRAAGADGEGVAKGLGAAFSKSMSAGLKGGADAVKGALSTIKSTILSIGGIAGGIGIAELAREGMKTEGVFRKLAFSIKSGGNAAVDFRTMMETAQKVALETGQSATELGQTMQAVFTETGNSEFAQKSISDIAVAATGAHEPLETMGAIAGTLNKKFGITSDQIQESLATVVGLGNKGGVSVSEMSEKLSLMGAFAKEAGLSGQAGFSQMIGLMNVADQSTGTLKKGISAIGGILETLGTTASRNKALMQIGIDPSSAKGDIQQTIGQILQKTGGSKDKLAVAFQGEQLKVLADLGKNYSAVFSETKGDVKTKTAAAIGAYSEALSRASGSSVTFADLQREAGAEMQTNEKKMSVALEKLKAAFTSDKIQAAIGKLIDVMPKLADMIASVVGFAADHPAAAGALAIGGVAAQGFGSAALSSLLGAVFKTGGATAASEIGGALATGGGGAASAIGGVMATGATAIAAAGVAFAAGMALRHAYNEHVKEENEKDLKEVDASGTGQVANKTNNEFMTYARDENGNLVAKKSDVATLSGGSTQGVQTGGFGGALQAMTDRLMAGLMAGAGGETLPVTTITGTKGGAPDPAPAIREALSRTLRVEVTNPEAIRGAGPGGPGGSPLPGRAPRS